MNPILTAIISLCLPNSWAIWLLNLQGHQIHRDAYIGWSWLQCHSIKMDAHSRIGHFNLIRITSLELGSFASIRQLNRMKGPFTLRMEKRAAIGQNNSIYRAASPITIGASQLELGELAIITSKHSLDCTCSIHIGAFSTISGFGTQLWTHGFYHANEGAERIRIDGPIWIGNNVSIGSRCLINPGVSIAKAINVGGNACISKSLTDSGMYVSQGLRFVPKDIHSIRQQLTPKNEYQIVEVYEKSIA